MAFVTKMSENCKSTSPTAIQMKNQQKAIGKEEKLDIRSQPEKDEQIFYICGNILFAHISVRSIHDNADRITESVCAAILPQSYGNEPYQNLWM